MVGAKALFGIVGDRQGPGLSSTAREELGVFRDGPDGQKSSVSALRALQAAQKFNTDVSPIASVPLLLCASSSHPTPSCCPPTVRLTPPPKPPPSPSPLHTNLHSLASSSVSDPVSLFTSCCFLPAPARNRTALDARVLRIVTPAPLCTPNSNYSARTLPTGRLPLQSLSHELWFLQTAAQTCFSPPREAAIEVDLLSQTH